MRRSLTLLAIVAVALFTLSSAAFAATPVERSVVAHFTDEEWTAYGGRPSVSGNRAAWSTQLFESQDVMVKDLVTGAVTRITGAPEQEWAPEISTTRVAYLNTTNAGDHVYVYDLTTGARTRLTSSRVPQASGPRLYGSTVVWSDTRSGSRDVYVYELSTRTQRRIASGAGDQGYPAIWGRQVLYTDEATGNGDIWMYDLASSVRSRLTSDSAQQYGVTVWGNRAAWSNATSGVVETMVLSTRERSTIDVPGGQSDSPDLSGSRLAYRSVVPTATDANQLSVRLRDLVSGHDLEVDAGTLLYNDAEEPPLFGRLAISGDRVVWQHGHTIQGARMSAPQITNATRSSALYGTAPEVSGFLLEPGGGTPIAGGTVRMQVSKDGTTWIASGETTASDTYYGHFWFNGPTMFGDRWVRFYYPGDANHLAVTSAAVHVRARSRSMLHRSSWQPTIDWGDATTVVGRLEDISKHRNVAGRPVHLEWRKATTKPWTRAATTKITDKNGRVSYTVHMTSKTYYRFVYDGSADLAPDVGSTMIITPRVYLSTPSGPSRIAKNKAFTSRGYMKPYHSLVAYVQDRAELYIHAEYRQKQADGSYAWIDKGTVMRQAWPEKYKTYNSYEASMKLIHKGRWRIRASHREQDGSHAPTYSGYRYITVY